MMTLSRFLLICLANLMLSIPVCAKLIEKDDLRFVIDAENIIKGNIHFAFLITTPREIIEKYPDFYDLDSLALLGDAGVKVMLTKSAYIVSKPIGFFDHQHMKDENYLSHLLKDQKVSKIGENTFKVTVPNNYSYKLKTYFDSDDISTLPNSKIIQAVSTARKLDIISQSASSIVFREMTEYSKFGVGATNLSSFIPLKESKTLVISYTLTAVKKSATDKKALRAAFLENLSRQKKLIETFK